MKRSTSRKYALLREYKNDNTTATQFAQICFSTSRIKNICPGAGHLSLPGNTYLLQGNSCCCSNAVKQWQLVHMFNADADVETTYPTAEIIQNLSKETTIAEPCNIYGVGRERQRLASINLTGGRVNAVEIIETICGWPQMDEWLEEAKKDFDQAA